MNKRVKSVWRQDLVGRKPRTLHETRRSLKRFTVWYLSPCVLFSRFCFQNAKMACRQLPSALEPVFSISLKGLI